MRRRSFPLKGRHERSIMKWTVDHTIKFGDMTSGAGKEVKVWRELAQSWAADTEGTTGGVAEEGLVSQARTEGVSQHLPEGKALQVDGTADEHTSTRSEDPSEARQAPLCRFKVNEHFQRVVGTHTWERRAAGRGVSFTLCFAHFKAFLQSVMRGVYYFYCF